MSLFQLQHSWLTFEIHPVSISAVMPAILTEIIRDFPPSCRSNAVRIPRLSHNRFQIISNSAVVLPFQTTNYTHRSRDSSVGIATGYGLDGRGVRDLIPGGSRIFSFPHNADRLWGPPNLLSNGYGGAFAPGVKRPGRETHHSVPTTAEVKKL
jgi:hypothetical protein